MNLEALRIVATSWPLTFAWTGLLLACVGFYIIRTFNSKERATYSVIDQRSKNVEATLTKLVELNYTQNQLLRFEKDRKGQ